MGTVYVSLPWSGYLVDRRQFQCLTECLGLQSKNHLSIVNYVLSCLLNMYSNSVANVSKQKARSVSRKVGTCHNCIGPSSIDLRGASRPS